MASNDRRLFRYPAPAADMSAFHCTSTIVRKSRFLAQTCRVGSREEARKFVESIRNQRADATHNCWAFMAGPPGDTACVGSSDDGEPHGTAGRPMLNALAHCGIGQICVVVSRWFGGIKLGTGGLVRAYQDAVRNNLESLPLINVCPRCRWHLETGYEWLPAINRLLPEHEAIVEEESWGERASFLLTAPLDRSEDLARSIAGASNGQALLREAGGNG